MRLLSPAQNLLLALKPKSPWTCTLCNYKFDWIMPTEIQDPRWVNFVTLAYLSTVNFACALSSPHAPPLSLYVISSSCLLSLWDHSMFARNKSTDSNVCEHVQVAMSRNSAHFEIFERKQMSCAHFVASAIRLFFFSFHSGTLCSITEPQFKHLYIFQCLVNCAGARINL